MGQNFKIASTRNVHRLFPVPVVQGGKYLIELNYLWEAKCLQSLLSKGWIRVNLEDPSNFWKELDLHTDGNTRRFCPVWEGLKLDYFPREKGMEADLKKVESLEKVISRHFSNLVLDRLGSTVVDPSLLRQLELKIESQKNCKTCHTLGIHTVDLDSLLKTDLC